MKTKKFAIIETGASLMVEVADTFFGRFFGLMGRRRLESGHGLFLAPCNSIHMCFMRFSIDAIYVDKDFKIKKIVTNLRPWLGLSICFGAFGVIEVPSGDAEKLSLRAGQSFDISLDELN